MNGDENRILDYVNSITKLIIQDEFILEKCIRTCQLPYSEADLIFISQKLIELRYAVMETPKAGNITSFFREVHSAGGHYAFLAQKIQAEKDEVKYRAELENLEVTHKLNKWLFKTKWLPHILSVTAIIISIFSLVNSCEKGSSPIKSSESPSVNIQSVQ